jgi:hypothetical protein
LALAADNQPNTIPATPASIATAIEMSVIKLPHT